MEHRALRRLLDEVDLKQEWRGLKKVLTPEGHYLLLCKEHAEEYKK
jgi:internalin A